MWWNEKNLNKQKLLLCLRKKEDELIKENYFPVIVLLVFFPTHPKYLEEYSSTKWNFVTNLSFSTFKKILQKSQHTKSLINYDWKVQTRSWLRAKRLVMYLSFYPSCLVHF